MQKCWILGVITSSPSPSGEAAWGFTITVGEVCTCVCFWGMSVYRSECVCMGLCVCIRCVSVPMTPQRSKIKNSERILCINPGKGGDTSMFLFYVN